VREVSALRVSQTLDLSLQRSHDFLEHAPRGAAVLLAQVRQNTREG
jgi:hypothetical protein